MPSSNVDTCCSACPGYPLATLGGTLPIDGDRLLDQLRAFCAEQPSASGEELFMRCPAWKTCSKAPTGVAPAGVASVDIPPMLLALRDEPRIGAGPLRARAQ